MMFIIGILFETVSQLLKWGSLHEQLALLVFGIGLFILPISLRLILKRRDERTSRMLRGLNEAVAVENG